MKKTAIRLLVLYIFIIPSAILYSQELTPEQIYEKINDCVVVVHSYDFSNNLSTRGSGVVINDKGWIVTNYHVFAECERMEIKHNSKEVKYTDIIGVDVEKDILILKIDDFSFPPIPIANSDNLKVGQRVYAIGSPLGLENSMSEGIISGIRNVEERNRNYIQITASISAGSSGGAVVNSRGELIGISTMTLKEGQNLNFAIPVNDIMKITLGSFSDKKYVEANNYFYKGYNAVESGNYNDAIKYFTKNLEIFPNNAKAYYNRGRIYYNLQNYDNAISDFTKAIQLNPDFAEAYNNRGVTYGDLQNYDKAIPDFTKAIQINPDDAEAYYSRGLTYYGLRNYDKAISDYTKAIQLNPDYAEAYYNRGITYYDLKNYDKAISDYTKAIQLNPDDVDAYYNRGLTYYNSGNTNKACEDWKKAYSLGDKEAKDMLNKYCK